MLMRRVLTIILFFILTPPAFCGSEVAAGDYRVSYNRSAGWQIFWQERCLSAGAFPSLVIGPGWKQVVFDKESWSRAQVACSADTITAICATGLATMTLTAKVAASGVILTCRFDTQAAPLEDVGFWFMALPQTDFADCAYQLSTGEKRRLPVAIERDSEKKSQWRISPDAETVTVFSPHGTTDRYQPSTFLSF